MHGFHGGALSGAIGDNATPELSGGLSLGPLSSRRIQVSVCGPARKTHLRFTYKGSVDYVQSIGLRTGKTWLKAPQAAAAERARQPPRPRGGGGAAAP